MEGKALGPSPLREAATSPPQADHVLVDLFFIHGGWGGLRQSPPTPYDLTFKWNLINNNKKTSKQNITRDIEIRNNLTVTRGEVEVGSGGERVKGLQEQL